MLESDLAGEYDARTSYKKSREICQELGDYVTMKLFEELLKDEEGHIDFLETQLHLLATIGDEKYGQLNAASGQRGRVGHANMRRAMTNPCRAPGIPAQSADRDVPRPVVAAACAVACFAPARC